MFKYNKFIPLFQFTEQTKPRKYLVVNDQLGDIILFNLYINTLESFDLNILNNVSFNLDITRNHDLDLYVNIVNPTDLYINTDIDIALER